MIFSKNRERIRRIRCTPAKYPPQNNCPAENSKNRNDRYFQKSHYICPADAKATANGRIDQKRPGPPHSEGGGQWFHAI